MEMTGERRLPTARLQVWRALNDPEILQRCIPGCRSVEPVGPESYRITAAVTIGSQTTDFTGDFALLDLLAPVSYRVEGSGKLGSAGLVRGGARVHLDEDGDATILRYTISTEGSAASAQSDIGPVEARRLADEFLDALTVNAVSPAPVAADGPAALAAAIPSPSRLPFPIPGKVLGFPLFAWAAAAVFLFIVFNLFAA